MSIRIGLRGKLGSVVLEVDTPAQAVEVAKHLTRDGTLDGGHIDALAAGLARLGSAAVVGKLDALPDAAAPADAPYRPPASPPPDPIGGAPTTAAPPDELSVAGLIYELEAMHTRLDRLYSRATSGTVRKTCYWILGCLRYHIDALKPVQPETAFRDRRRRARLWSLKPPWSTTPPEGLTESVSSE